MSDHGDLSVLLPWYVNGTLRESDRQRIESHLRDCASCRHDVSVERRVHDAVSADGGIDYIPRASLKRLNARLDQAAGIPVSVADMPAPAQEGRRRAWHGALAASAAVAAIAGGLIADRIVSGREEAAAYHTVTRVDPRSADEVIRAVFSPNIKLAELQSLLDEAHLRIISGPSEAGVYSLAAVSKQPVSASLAILRQHAAVRFAEGTRADLDAPVPR